jgi:uncharacterized membrane protein
VTAQAVAASVAVFALVGILDSLYFVLVAYRWMRPDPRWMPPVCRMDGNTCARIVDTPQGHLFRVPNGLVGLAYYGLVLAAATDAFVAGTWRGCLLLLTAAGLALATSVYLAWALLARLKVTCALCLLGHALNLGLVLLLAAACMA